MRSVPQESGGSLIFQIAVTTGGCFWASRFQPGNYKRPGLAVLVGVGRCHEIGILQGFLQEAKLKVDSGIHSQAPVACASLCLPLIGSLHAAFQVAQIAVAAEQAINGPVIGRDTRPHDAAAVASESDAKETGGPEQV